jgi:SAM-dependent methyltransferase
VGRKPRRSVWGDTMPSVEHDRVAAAMAEQLTYYRWAAANFDRYVYRALVDEVISRLRERVDLSGDVLEIACGAGQWTERLAESARLLTAIDATPEMLEFARKRLEGCRADQVELICTDVFDWRPRRQYQAVFSLFGCPTYRQPGSRHSGNSWRPAWGPMGGSPSLLMVEARQRPRTTWTPTKNCPLRAAAFPWKAGHAVGLRFRL